MITFFSLVPVWMGLGLFPETQMFKDLLDDISWSMKLIMRIPPWIWTSKGGCFINFSDEVPRAPRA